MRNSSILFMYGFVMAILVTFKEMDNWAYLAGIIFIGLAHVCKAIEDQ